MITVEYRSGSSDLSIATVRMGLFTCCRAPS